LVNRLDPSEKTGKKPRLRCRHLPRFRAKP
jgi:hypothetical protein